MDEKLFTIGQAAEYLGVSLNTLRRWDESGKLVAIKKDGGTHRYYREKDLEIFASDLMKFASEWIQDGVEFPGAFYCPTSSIFNARLTKMEYALMQKPGFEKLYSLRWLQNYSCYNFIFSVASSSDFAKCFSP